MDKELTKETKMEKKHNNSFKAIILLVVFICIIITIIVSLINILNRNKKMNIIKQVQIENNANCKYIYIQNNLIKYNSDGASCVDEGKEKWNQSYEMRVPLSNVCDNTAIIFDKGGNNISILNKDGEQGKIKTTYPIVKAKVSQQGVVSAILEDEKATYIELYDKTGEVLVSMKSILTKTGYPLDVAISKDGKKIAVSYLNINGVNMETKVVFYNFDEVGKNEEDRVVGGFNQYKSTLVPQIEFLTNDTVLAFGENMYTIYKIGEIPSIIKEEKIDYQIKKIFYNSEHFGFVYEDNNTNCFDLFDLSGKKICKYKYEDDYNNISISDKSIIMINPNRLAIVSTDGKEKFNLELSEEVNNIFNVSKNKKFILISNSNIKYVTIE